MERTLVLIKPDALQRGLVGEIISRFERKGLKIIAVKMLRMSPELAREHYSHLVGKPFYPELEKFMTSMPIIAMVLEGKDAVSVVRKLVGATNAREAEPGTIRGDLSMSVSKNVVHASDSLETAEAEIKRFFSEDELYPWQRKHEEFFYAEDEL